MRLGATYFHTVSSPSAVAIRENIVTEEPGLEDSGNTPLRNTCLSSPCSRQGVAPATEKSQVSL